MSNDLISRSALMEGRVENDPVRIAAMCAETAYDVDAVIEEIKDCGAETCASVSCNGECSECDHGALMKTLVEIVRNGGKKE